MNSINNNIRKAAVENLNQENYSRAIFYFKKWVDLYPDDHEAHLEIIYCYHKQSYLDKCKEFYSVDYQHSNKDLIREFFKAEQFYYDDKYDKSVQLYKKILNKEFDKSVVLNSLALSYDGLNDFINSMDYSIEAFRADQSNMGALNSFFVNAFSEGQFHEIELKAEEFGIGIEKEDEEAIRIKDITFSNIKRNKLRLLLRNENLDVQKHRLDSHNYVKRVLRIYKIFYATQLVKKSISAYKASDYNQATKLTYEVLQEFPFNFYLCRNMLYFLYLSDSLSLMDRVIEKLYPEESKMIDYWKGSREYYRDNYEEADKYIGTLVRKTTHYPPMNFTCARIWKSLELHNEANELYSEVYDQNPVFLSALDEIIAELFKEGKYKEIIDLSPGYRIHRKAFREYYVSSDYPIVVIELYYIQSLFKLDLIHEAKAHINENQELYSELNDERIFVWEIGRAHV